MSNLVTAFGRTMTISQWSNETGVPAMTIRNRLKQGIPPKMAVSLKSNRKPRPDALRYTYDGQTMTLREWAPKKDIPSGTLYHRLRRGWSFDKAISKEISPKKRYCVYDTETSMMIGLDLTAQQVSELIGVQIATVYKYVYKLRRGIKAGRYTIVPSNESDEEGEN